MKRSERNNKRQTLITAIHFTMTALLVVAVAAWTAPGACVARSYTSINGQERSSDPGNVHASIEVPLKNTLKPVTATEARSVADGVIIFAFPTCPYCRNLMPELVSVANETGTPIYYCQIDKYRDRYEYIPEAGEIVETIPAGEGYLELTEWLGDYLYDYTVTNGAGEKVDMHEKRIGAPTVVTIENGQPVSSWKLDDIENVEWPEDKYERWDEEFQEKTSDSLRTYLTESETV